MAPATHLKSVSRAISGLYFNRLFLHTFLTFIIIMLFCMNFSTLKTEWIMKRRCRKNHSHSGSQLESNRTSWFFSCMDTSTWSLPDAPASLGRILPATRSATQLAQCACLVTFTFNKLLASNLHSLFASYP